MPLLSEVLASLEAIAPLRFAFEGDRVGLQVGDPDAEVGRGVVSLDWSLGLLEFARERRAQLIVAHHPLIWEPLRAIDETCLQGRFVAEMIRAGIAYVACHTNWDSAQGGVNDALAERLGLKGASPFGGASKVGYLKLVTSCPPASAEAIIDALSNAGAGVIGLYERCAFVSEGEGTFRGLPGSQPAVGVSGEIERVRESRIEMRVPEGLKDAVREALWRAHPYEEPPCDFYRLDPAPEQPAGRIGSMERQMTLDDFRRHVDEALGTRCLAWGDPRKVLRRVAVVGGSADGEWRAALASGADAFVTGEVRQHVALEASQCGIAVISAGHFATEQPGCLALRDRLEAAQPQVQWELFAPSPGHCGRPL